jgi:hypothetical protein
MKRLSIGILAGMAIFYSTTSASAVSYPNYVDGNELIEGQLYVKDKGYFKKSNTVVGSEIKGIVSVTTAETAAEATHNVILANGALTVTLPAVSGNTGISFTIVNTGTQTITIDPNASEKLNGTSTSATMTTQYDWRQVITNGVEWFFIGKNP